MSKRRPSTVERVGNLSKPFQRLPLPTPRTSSSKYPGLAELTQSIRLPPFNIGGAARMLASRSGSLRLGMVRVLRGWGTGLKMGPLELGLYHAAVLALVCVIAPAFNHPLLFRVRLAGDWSLVCQDIFVQQLDDA